MNLRGYLIGVTLLFSLGAFVASCEKEVTQETTKDCKCYEQHETLEPVVVNGIVGVAWQIQYETEPTSQNCENETGNYVYKSQSERYKIVCY